MTEKIPICPECGESEYFEAEGFYYCSKCHTQTQEIKVQLYEYCRGPINKKTVKREKKKEVIEDGEEWTTWELYNFILKGMVDELIALGASEKFKLVVLQLWATYLQKLEAAFISRREYILPKLGLGFRERDAKLIYGAEKKIQNKEKFKRRPKDDVSVAAAPSLTALSHDYSEYRRCKKQLFKAEYEKSSEQMEVDVCSMLNESMKSFNTLQSVESKELRRTYFTKTAREVHLTPGSSRTSVHNHPETLNRSVIIAILYIALMTCQEKIQLSDILRWIEEGELSYYEVTHFLPDRQHIKGEAIKMFQIGCVVSYASLFQKVRDMIRFLNIIHIPSPDMLQLVARYLDDLQLPGEMVSLVERLMCLSSELEQSNSSSKKSILENYEGQAMAFIIVTLKLLLGLDGETEYKISEVAEELNKYVGNTSESSKLFVWTDWVKYVECRNVLIAQYHFPTQYALFKDADFDPSAFINYWDKAKAKDVKRKEHINCGSDGKTDPQFVKAVTSVLQQLQNIEENNMKIPEFIPSFTSQKTNLKTLFFTKPGSFESAPAVDSVLKQNFRRMTMNYLIEPELYVALAEKHGIKISVLKNSAQDNIQIVDNIRVKHFHSKSISYQIKRKIKNNPYCSVEAENVHSGLKRKDEESEHNLEDKRIILHSPEFSECNNFSKIVPENKNSASTSHHVKETDSLLRQVKAKNIQINNLTKNEKGESCHLVPLECAENDFIAARTRNALLQLKIAQSCSPDSAKCNYFSNNSPAILENDTPAARTRSAHLQNQIAQSSFVEYKNSPDLCENDIPAIRTRSAHLQNQIAQFSFVEYKNSPDLCENDIPAIRTRSAHLRKQRAESSRPTVKCNNSPALCENDISALRTNSAYLQNQRAQSSVVECNSSPTLCENNNPATRTRSAHLQKLRIHSSSVECNNSLAISENGIPATRTGSAHLRKLRTHSSSVECSNSPALCENDIPATGTRSAQLQKQRTQSSSIEYNNSPAFSENNTSATRTKNAHLQKQVVQSTSAKCNNSLINSPAVFENLSATRTRSAHLQTQIVQTSSPGSAECNIAFKNHSTLFENDAPAIRTRNAHLRKQTARCNSSGSVKCNNSFNSSPSLSVNKETGYTCVQNPNTVIKNSFSEKYILLNNNNIKDECILEKNIIRSNSQKQDNIETKKKAKLNSSLSSEYNEICNPCERRKGTNSQKRIACSNSLRSPQYTDSLDSSIALTGYNGTRNTSAKHSKTTDLDKNSSPVKPVLLTCLKENNFDREDFSASTPKSNGDNKSVVQNDTILDSEFDSDEDYEINSESSGSESEIESGTCSDSDFDSDKNGEINNRNKNKTKINRNHRELDSKFKLYISNSKYWFYDANVKKMRTEDFDTRVMSKFPPSFQWLLQQCANILHMTERDLYGEVINLELLISSSSSNNKMKKDKC